MPYPTISDDLYLPNNEQASLACAAAFCFAHVEHNLIKHKLYNNWSEEFKQTNQIHNKKTNPKIIILEILVYKIQPEIIKSKIFRRFNIFTKPWSQETWLCNKVEDLYFVYQNSQNGYIFRLFFLLYFLKLSVGNGFWNNLQSNSSPLNISESTNVE